MDEREELIGAHGGYRNLKSFQIARLIYDVTVLFCERYIDKRSRTYDQMVQAARSGTQNIAEGSVASATSRRTEIKLTNVARSSQAELANDYEDFLRQRHLPLLNPYGPSMKRFKALRCSTLAEVEAWVKQEAVMTGSVSVREGRCGSVPPEALLANAALSLLNLDAQFLKRQIKSQADVFEKEGGFSERMSRVRKGRLTGRRPGQDGGSGNRC